MVPVVGPDIYISWLRTVVGLDISWFLQSVRICPGSCNWSGYVMVPVLGPDIRIRHGSCNPSGYPDMSWFQEYVRISGYVMVPVIRPYMSCFL